MTPHWFILLTAGPDPANSLRMNSRMWGIAGVLLLFLGGGGGVFWLGPGADPGKGTVRQVPVTEEEVQQVLGREIADRPVAFDVEPGQDIAEVLLTVFRDGGRSPVTIQISGAGPTERALAYSGTLGGGLAHLLSANGLVLWKDERGVVRIEEDQTAQ